MIDSDLERFDDIVAGAYEIFEGELTPNAFSLWVNLLNDFELDDIEKAFLKYFKINAAKTIPSPREIIALLKEGTREQELLNQADLHFKQIQNKKITRIGKVKEN